MRTSSKASITAGLLVAVGGSFASTPFAPTAAAEATQQATAALPAEGEGNVPSPVGNGTPTSSGSNPSPPPAAAPAGIGGRLRATPVPPKVARFAERQLARYDADGSGALERHEWDAMRGTPRLFDLNDDGHITALELAERIAAYGRARSLRLLPQSFSQDAEVRAPFGGAARFTDRTGEGSAEAPRDVTRAEDRGRAARWSRKFFVPAARLPANLPEWFADQDTNGDGQLSMREFSAQWTVSEAARFQVYDRNGDGVVTAAECVAAAEREQAATSTPVDESASPPVRVEGSRN